MVPYEERQAARDKEYLQAWDDAPQSFKKEAASLGMDKDLEVRDGMAAGYNDGSGHRENSEFTPDVADLISYAYTPDMALLIDDYVDQVIEKRGVQHEVFIREIYEDLKKPMHEEAERNRSLLLGRIAMLLCKNEKGNMNATVHALLHSIPGLAADNGFPSLRSSAKECKVSPEWLRKTRDWWCDNLEIPVPVNGTKSAEAKSKYKANALNNHWRNQRYKAP